MAEKHTITAAALKGWEVFLSWLFKYPSRCFALKDPSDLETYVHDTEILRSLAENHSRFSPIDPILCKVTKDNAHIEIIREVLLNLTEDIPDEAVCEVLAKGLAYRGLHEGMEFTIFGKSYVVDKVFNLWNQMAAYGLTSDSGEPLLLFRGTDASLMSEGGRASMISDLDPKGPGRSLFYYAKSGLRDWLTKCAKRGEKARLVGHSLGGVFVAYTLISESPLVNRDKYSYAFNHPGIPKDLLEEWNAIPDEQKPAFEGIVARGDVVSKFGHLFGRNIEVSFEEPLNPLTAHERLLYAAPVCYMHEIDVETENNSESRTYYSKLQKQTSLIIYQMGLKHLFPTQH
ncbi:MAG: hypothetical protein SP1CHLAM54_07410 [Chlamydiia bacterium]|nr:hypothetical protein [Chlamydiia bacterium]MCH9615647.1 hypothetical protein [Chlamydiia bacterium]MCH9628950.1 hypothetical protein [Chlamydiia bacterium]